MDRIRITNKEPSPVLVVGSVGYDDIETPFSADKKILGGSASYACLAASYFAPTRMVGVVGNDFATKDLDRLKAHDIDLTGLQVDESGPTFYWSGKYLEQFKERETLDIQLNVFEKFQPVLPEEYQQSPYVLLGNIHPALQKSVLDQLKNKDAFVAVDTIDLWIKTERKAFLDLIREIDLLVINDSEAELLTDKNNMIEAGRALRELGPQRVVVKKGEHGAYLFHENGIFTLPAYPVTELHDPTGAGDSFLGAAMGTLAALGKHDLPSLKKALLYGTAVASLTVEAFSCNRLESAGPSTIQERVKTLQEMVAI